jgi:REP element-mobilizing transposase RayT
LRVFDEQTALVWILMCEPAMPRRPRLLFPEAIYHVMTRGNRRAIIFEDDHDRERFLHILAETAERYGVRCYAYCLMGTHYHLVLITPRGNLSEVMQHLNGTYARWSNRRHQRGGHVFESRFRAFVIQRESYLRRVARYVVLNPVRAHLVLEPAEWVWSSYRAMIGLTTPPQFLSLDWMTDAFGGSDLTQGQQQFARYVSDPVRRSPPIDMNAPVVGSGAFQAAVLARATRDALAIPRRWRLAQRPSLDQLFENCHNSLSQRNEAIWSAHATHGYRLSEIARALHLHPSTASYIVRRRSSKLR